MDDVDVKIEEEELLPPENSNPAFLTSSYALVAEFVSQYGWYILPLAVILYILWNRFQRSVHNSSQLRAHKKYDSSEVEKRQLAMDAHRQKLQDEHDRKAAIHAAKQTELAEKKRQEKLEDWDRHQSGLGYRSKVKKAAESEAAATVIPGTKKKLRDNDYSPLMGSDGGESCSWSRPSRRGPAGGGG